MKELFPELAEGPDSDHVIDLQDLVKKVQHGELPTMSSREVDALDEAVEMGLIDEMSLRVQGGADAAA
jgi:hypothetical protein